MSRASEGELSQDVVFDLLSSSRRRFILHHLRNRDEPVELGELATELAAWENNEQIEDVTEQQRKRVYVSLYQTHIPKLEEAGLVSYDSDSGEVTLLSTVRGLGRYLAAEEEPFPWQLYYLGLAGVSLAFYLLVLLDVPGFALIPNTAAVVLVIVAFGLSAIAQSLIEGRTDWSLPLSNR